MPVSSDRRLRAFNVMIFFGIFLHLCQQACEEPLWSSEVLLKAFLNPGWHLELPMYFPLAVSIALLIAVLFGIYSQTRRSAFIVTALFSIQFFTYPIRIRNHMELLLAGLGLQCMSWIVTGRRDQKKGVDHAICDGLALILVVTYFCAGFQKLNTHFISLDPALSWGARGILEFFAAGRLPIIDRSSLAVLGIGVTVCCELIFPVLIWKVNCLREILILFMLAFHFPHISTMGASDYPMIAISFYPALFPEQSWNDFESELLKRWDWKNILGMLLGIFANYWFVTRWTFKTEAGFMVAALWGFAAVTLIKISLKRIVCLKMSK